MADKFYDSTPRQSTVIGPFNRCIYCGAEDIDALSREHVVPYGLFGSIILLKASCPACRKITASFENDCLRNMYGPARAHGKYPSREKRRGRKSRDTIDKYLDNGTRERISAHMSPNFIPAIKFRYPPGILIGDMHANTHVDVHIIVNSNQPTAAKGAAIGFRFHYQSFIRLIAKIAHGIAATHWDLGSFKPTLLDLILKSDMQKMVFIGAGEFSPPFRSNTGDANHKIRSDVITVPNGQFAITHYIQLFGHAGAPTYQVISGVSDVAPRHRDG